MLDLKAPHFYASIMQHAHNRTATRNLPAAVKQLDVIYLLPASIVVYVSQEPDCVAIQASVLCLLAQYPRVHITVVLTSGVTLFHKPQRHDRLRDSCNLCREQDPRHRTKILLKINDIY